MRSVYQAGHSSWSVCKVTWGQCKGPHPEGLQWDLHHIAVFIRLSNSQGILPNFNY